MHFIKKNFWELFFTSGHIIFGIGDLVHEIRVGDLNWSNILSLNTFFEVGSTLFGIGVLVAFFRIFIKKRVLWTLGNKEFFWSAKLYGKEASNFTKNLLMGESVYLWFDVDQADKYGRLLAYLYRAPDGLFVNLEIVRQGYGHAYTDFPFKHSVLFQHYSAKAREAGKGLYGVVQPDPNAPEPPKAVQDGQIYVTRTGKKYHRDGCSSLRKSKIPISLADAKQRYGPCGRCNPPR